MRGSKISLSSLSLIEHFDARPSKDWLCVNSVFSTRSPFLLIDIVSVMLSSAHALSLICLVVDIFIGRVKPCDISVVISLCNNFSWLMAPL